MNDLLNLSSLSVLVAVLVLPITSCRRTDSRLAVMNIPAEVTCARRGTLRTSDDKSH